MSTNRLLPQLELDLDAISKYKTLMKEHDLPSWGARLEAGESILCCFNYPTGHWACGFLWLTPSKQPFTLVVHNLISSTYI